MCSPMLRGSNSHFFGINDLSVTRANGKKATQLCPCGYATDPERACRCTPDRISSYQQRISGPLLDRIDLQLEVPRLSEEERKALLDDKRAAGPSSAELRERVIACRAMQLKERGCINARL